MTFDALIFDLDGTLVDTAPDLHAALDYVLTSCGRSTVALEDVRQMVGDGARALVRRGLDATGGVPAAPTFEALAQSFLTYYGNHVADLSRPFPGVRACLGRLNTRGLALGVCTNKPTALSESLLRKLGLGDYFGAVVGGDRLATRKPDGGHVVGTLAAMGQSGARAAMIGDSANDVAAARSAGLPVVAVTFGYTIIPPAQLGADLLIDHFDALEDALARLGRLAGPPAEPA